LFIDAEEATAEQLKFISRVKRLYFLANEGGRQFPFYIQETQETNETTDLYTQGSDFSIPPKFSHVDLDA
jgi:hypothetical protein